MPSSIEFIRLAPELRRFARIVTGHQDSGDKLVTATLELISKTQIETGETSARLVYLRAMTDLWLGEYGDELREHGTGNGPNSGNGSSNADSRQAYLLKHVAGLRPRDIGFVLRRDAETAERLVDVEERSLADARPANVLIIEDELFVAADLEAIVEGLGHTVVGLATTRTNAVALAKEHRPDIILSDIQLADGSSGLDAATDIAEYHTAPTVFITAFPERLLTGQGAEPAYLIEKPFRADDIRTNLSQALFVSRQQYQLETIS
jgi:CheY-like chemotaxis protein